MTHYTSIQSGSSKLLPSIMKSSFSKDMMDSIGHGRSLFGGAVYMESETNESTNCKTKGLFKQQSRLANITSDVDDGKKQRRFLSQGMVSNFSQNTSQSILHNIDAPLTKKTLLIPLKDVDPQLFYKKEKYTPILKTFSHKTTDTTEDFRQMLGAFALEKDEKEHQLKMLLKDTQHNILSLDQVIQAKREFEAKHSTEVSGRLRDISKQMNRRYQDSETYLMDLVKSQGLQNELEDRDFGSISRELRFHVELVQRSTAQRILKMASMKVIEQQQSRNPKTIQIGQGNKKKQSSKVEVLENMLNQKQQECEKKAYELNDLCQKFDQHDQKLQHLYSEIDQYRNQINEIEMQRMLDMEKKMRSKQFKNEQGVQVQIMDPFMNQITQQLQVLMLENNFLKEELERHKNSVLEERNKLLLPKSIEDTLFMILRSDMSTDDMMAAVQELLALSKEDKVDQTKPQDIFEELRKRMLPRSQDASEDESKLGRKFTNRTRQTKQDDQSDEGSQQHIRVRDNDSSSDAEAPVRNLKPKLNVPAQRQGSNDESPTIERSIKRKASIKLGANQTQKSSKFAEQQKQINNAKGAKLPVNGSQGAIKTSSSPDRQPKLQKPAQPVKAPTEQQRKQPNPNRNATVHEAGSDEEEPSRRSQYQEESVFSEEEEETDPTTGVKSIVRVKKQMVQQVERYVDEQGQTVERKVFVKMSAEQAKLMIAQGKVERISKAAEDSARSQHQTNNASGLTSVTSRPKQPSEHQKQVRQQPSSPMKSPRFSNEVKGGQKRPVKVIKQIEDVLSEDEEVVDKITGNKTIVRIKKQVVEVDEEVIDEQGQVVVRKVKKVLPLEQAQALIQQGHATAVLKEMEIGAGDSVHTLTNRDEEDNEEGYNQEEGEQGTRSGRQQGKLGLQVEQQGIKQGNSLGSTQQISSKGNPNKTSNRDKSLHQNDPNKQAGQLEQEDRSDEGQTDQIANQEQSLEQEYSPQQLKTRTQSVGVSVAMQTVQTQTPMQLLRPIIMRYVAKLNLTPQQLEVLAAEVKQMEREFAKLVKASEAGEKDLGMNQNIDSDDDEFAELELPIFQLQNNKPESEQVPTQQQLDEYIYTFASKAKDQEVQIYTSYDEVDLNNAQALVAEGHIKKLWERIKQTQYHRQVSLTHKRQVKELLDRIKQSFKKQPNDVLSYSEFKRFYVQVIQRHKPCGEQCVHLQRFFRLLGFETLFYLKRREIKPTKQALNPFAK